MLTPEQLKASVKRLKENPTVYETLFAARLKIARIKFKQQVTFGFYILDFILPDYLVNVEIDGSVHLNSQEHDLRRDQFAENNGLQVIRISNDDAETFDLRKLTCFPLKTKLDYQRSFGRAGAIKGQAYKNYKKKQRKQLLTKTK